MNSSNFHLFNTLTRHDNSLHGEWDGLHGRINNEMIKECGFPEPADDVLILSCGPPGMKKTVNDILKENGYVAGVHF